ncbi:SNF2-related protein [Anaeromyxobacter sp. PSR-1]|uniref:SNF2-related protein n=1 Tax=Anaeromyxobacter sp. PSR-1 TaxID=1300915 RepID=UPI0005DF6DA1|nr:SNF2-related protein [Anaeromyxobacter sp. PSR-1]GAO04758.1 putative ATP-dependent helicase YqhH [Anaeromyxobacter sp. PSR-1]
MGGVSQVASRAGSARPQLTRFHQRVAAEALTARGGGGTSRLAPALAHSAVDLNPHQIEAAAFALAALPTGGAVLADEVGLGKTVEAGLVLAQLAAEGKPRAVILVPASLRAQWREELRSKFGLEADVVDGDTCRERERQGLKTNPFDTGGIVICSHPFAALRAAEVERVHWDVAVIDEAHRLRNAYRKDHRTGQALRRALRRSPKLLLTATPLQNDLMELLGLAAFIDDALLGNEETFRLQYASGELTEDKAADLKARLAPVVVRTLRRQVKEYVKYTARRSIVEDFAPTAQEQELYDRVSEYLRREDAYAIPMARRALFVLVYRKILASSSFALAATLDRLADTLDQKIAGVECTAQADLLLEMDGFAEEVEELFDEDGAPQKPKGQLALRRMNDELGELRACARLAREIKVNAKGDALVRGLDRCFTVAKACGWPEKAVVFTEFRRTQDYLRRLLESKGYSVTCLSGDVGGTEKRAALVEEFRDRTQILLMTEAGAEGLNLQFCNLVVNYDLPWNPQRVEQRIGRCHRYGQQRDVLVLNFLNRSNAADARLFDLLSQKLALFDGVFGSSDEILGALGTGIDFEKRVLDIYQSCRSGEEIDRAFSKLRGELDDRISARFAAARALLFERFDGEVRGRLRVAEKNAKEAVARREADEEALVAAAFEEESAAPPPEEPARGRTRRAKLVQAAAERIRARPQDAVSFLELPNRLLPASLGKLAGREGWWFAYKYAFDALVSEERVVHLVLWFDGERFHALSTEDADAFAALPAEETQAGPRGATVSIGEAQEQALEAFHAALVADLQERIGAAYDASRDRWDRAVEDALAAPRKAVEDARAAWGRARGALGDRSDLPLRDRRALLERAEREYRRKLDDLRAVEAQRYAEKDRAVADLKKRSEVKERRTLVATAYWRCV